MKIKGLTYSIIQSILALLFLNKYKINSSFILKSFTMIISLYNAVEDWKILVNSRSLWRETLLG